MAPCKGSWAGKLTEGVATRPPPVAESREGSEWLRSVCNAGALSPRRTPGTATGLQQYEFAEVLFYTKVPAAQSLRQKSEIFATSLYTREALVRSNIAH